MIGENGAKTEERDDRPTWSALPMSSLQSLVGVYTRLLRAVVHRLFAWLYSSPRVQGRSSLTLIHLMGLTTINVQPGLWEHGKIPRDEICSLWYNFRFKQLYLKGYGRNVTPRHWSSVHTSGYARFREKQKQKTQTCTDGLNHRGVQHTLYQ